MTRVLYVCHPVGPYGDYTVGPYCDYTVADNLARAKRWLAWLLEREPTVAFCCPWLPLVEVMDDGVPANRARGLRDDCAIAALCDGIVLVGGKWSAGMRMEVDAYVAAHPRFGQYPAAVYDLTGLGDEPPGHGVIPGGALEYEGRRIHRGAIL